MTNRSHRPMHINVVLNKIFDDLTPKDEFEDMVKEMGKEYLKTQLTKIYDERIDHLAQVRKMYRDLIHSRYDSVFIEFLYHDSRERIFLLSEQLHNNLKTLKFFMDEFLN